MPAPINVPVTQPQIAFLVSVLSLSEARYTIPVAIGPAATPYKV